MKINITDPSTEMPLSVEAKAESYNNDLGYRIIYPNGTSFFILNRLGAWRSGDDHHVDPDLLIQIGLAIENQKYEKY